MKAGVDPLQARQTDEAERQNRKTFKDAADGWNQLINRKTRAEKTRDRDERMIGYLTIAFGNKPIDEVKPKDLIDLLETFEENGSYETRMRLQSTALNIAGFAQGKAWIEANPFHGIAFGNAFTSPRISSVRPSSRRNRSDSYCATSRPILVGSAISLAMLLIFLR